MADDKITISLSNTDYTNDVDWRTKDGPFQDNPHGSDSFFNKTTVPLKSISQIIQEANNEIQDDGQISSPEQNSETVLSAEFFGGGIVVGTSKDYSVNAATGAVNSFDVSLQTLGFMSGARADGGMTMTMFLHGASGEYKLLRGQDNSDGGGDFNADFYKESCYISFRSKESTQVVGSLTSNQISFRKSPHHVFVKLKATEMSGMSLSNALNGYSYIFFNSTLSQQSMQKISSFASGSTCGFNEAQGESTSASAVSNDISPQLITCTGKFLKFSSMSSNTLVMQNTTNTSLFSSAAGRGYQHNGLVDSSVQGVANYIMPQAQTMTIRSQNPNGHGSKNLLGFNTRNESIRLFGGPSNIGVTAGSYIRVSGSQNNDGVYQVLSIIDGIDGDSYYNTLSGGLPTHQYLELSRDIVPEQSVVGRNITIQNVSDFPKLHIKYRLPETE